MKYYLDTEFIEGFRKPILGRKRHYIDLISIGLVSEDERTYYAVCKDFNLWTAWYRYDIVFNPDKPHEDAYERVYWLRENVLKPIFKELVKEFMGTDCFPACMEFTYINMRMLVKEYGKTKKQIAAEVYDFVNPSLGFHTSSYSNSEFRNPESEMNKYFNKHNVIAVDHTYVAQPTFYADYSHYDWVVFCSMFGLMGDLPAGFPMFCMDLKQMSDEVYSKKKKEYLARYPKEQFIMSIDQHYDYPHQKEKHHALADAKWNKRFHEFLIRIENNAI